MESFRTNGAAPVHNEPELSRLPNSRVDLNQQGPSLGVLDPSIKAVLSAFSGLSKSHLAVRLVPVTRTRTTECLKRVAALLESENEEEKAKKAGEDVKKSVKTPYEAATHANSSSVEGD